MKHPDRFALKGMTFGLWRVIKEAESTRTPTSVMTNWICVCKCGTRRKVGGTNLVHGRSTSCGCSRRKPITHGMVYSREYQSWAHMIQRCTNPKNKDFKHYGGRGITICKRWMDFGNFIQDVGPQPSAGLTLGRIDNNKGYQIGNVQWETRKAQALNRRPFRWSAEAKLRNYERLKVLWKTTQRSAA